MTKKVRLIRGPFGSRVMDCSQAGSNVIRITGPKPMSRKQKWEWQRNAYNMYNFTIGIHGDITKSPEFPRVSAEYQLSVRPHRSGSGGVFMIPCQHPDGSLFYEYVKNSEREY